MHWRASACDEGWDRDVHLPVLLSEVIEWLGVRAGGKYCDATLGGAGHAAAILDASAEDGTLIAVDRDPSAVLRGRKRLSSYGERVVFMESNLAQIGQIASGTNFIPLDGVIADLGLSSYQIEQGERGFSFSVDGPLDMRMGPDASESAAELIRRVSESELADLLYQLAGERKSRRIARAIKAADRNRQLETTTDLREVVWRASTRSQARQGRTKRSRIHPATRTFQALRIAVNDELGALEIFLKDVWRPLNRGGRVAVIAFHSLEDRLVKHSFRERARQGEIRILTPKPLRPGESEVRMNPRARSARLRVAEKISC